MRKSSTKYFGRYKSSTTFETRFTLLLSIGFMLFILLLGRLYYLQVINYKHYNTLSETNRIKYVPTLPKRGMIFDRTGKLLADSDAMYSVDLSLSEVDDLKSTIRAMKSLIGISEKDIADFYSRKDKLKRHDVVTLKNHLTDEEVAKVLSVRHLYDGVDISAKLLRHYVYDNATSHIIGTVGAVDRKDLRTLDKEKYKNAEFIGKTGIEKYYDKILYGSAGYKIIEVNAKGRQVREVDYNKATSGKDIALTIDIELQKYAYEQLKNYIGAVVVLDPRNGEVLSLVSSPTFSANSLLWKNKTYNQNFEISSSPLFNRASNGLYSPASTIKPFIGLSALYHRVINPNRMIYAGPYFKLENSERKYRDWKPKGHGYVDLATSIIQSCDVYFYRLADLLGIDRISQFLENFQFGKVTGIDLPNESAGILPSRKWKDENIGRKWTKGETIITGIGQGYMLVTPLQLAVATSIIANKGKIILPKINSDFSHNISEKLLEKQEFLTSQISDESWERIQKSMFDVVNQSNGTAYWTTRDKKNMISGKTGTVQVYALSQDDDERDDKDVPKHLKDHSLFVGYAPVDDPKIVVATIVENVGSGSKYAAPISANIINYYLDKRISE
ncbi:MAG: penicillin-binding protein 2 [Pseudomonadota bacterium]|nr:penicillin-binding protein 2 [Pseudomonadota bacterium]